MLVSPRKLSGQDHVCLYFNGIFNAYHELYDVVVYFKCQLDWTKEYLEHWVCL